ncbi:MAG: hypothetical protein K2Z80_37735 [Xanthobacteraceae bacterium]|nr:hypothetical protein [Xanthobacteraceae bacterium]
MPNWAVQQLRVSLFSSEVFTLTEAVWTTITGQDEAENRNAVAGGKVYSGKFLGGKFSVGFGPYRCDIVLAHDESVGPAKEDEEISLPIIGPMEETMEPFVRAVSPTIEEASFPLLRIAFGATLISPAEDKRNSYVQIGEQLRSVKIDPDAMRDFIYRVNWPRQSSVKKDLEINRISTWTSMFVRGGLVQMTDKGVSVGMHSRELHATRLELDHNTSASNTEPFETATRLPILEELVSLARENAAAGEVS